MDFQAQSSGGHCCVCSKVCLHVGGPFYCEQHDPYRPRDPWKYGWGMSSDAATQHKIKQLEKKIDAIIEILLERLNAIG